MDAPITEKTVNSIVKHFRENPFAVDNIHATEEQMSAAFISSVVAGKAFSDLQSKYKTNRDGPALLEELAAHWRATGGAGALCDRRVAEAESVFSKKLADAESVFSKKLADAESVCAQRLAAAEDLCAQKLAVQIENTKSQLAELQARSSVLLADAEACASEKLAKAEALCAQKVSEKDKDCARRVAAMLESCNRGADNIKKKRSVELEAVRKKHADLADDLSIANGSIDSLRRSLCEEKEAHCKTLGEMKKVKESYAKVLRESQGEKPAVLNEIIAVAHGEAEIAKWYRDQVMDLNSGTSYCAAVVAFAEEVVMRMPPTDAVTIVEGVRRGTNQEARATFMRLLSDIAPRAYIAFFDGVHGDGNAEELMRQLQESMPILEHAEVLGNILESAAESPEPLRAYRRFCAGAASYMRIRGEQEATDHDYVRALLEVVDRAHVFRTMAIMKEEEQKKKHPAANQLRHISRMLELGLLARDSVVMSSMDDAKAAIEMSAGDAANKFETAYNLVKHVLVETSAE